MFQKNLPDLVKGIRANKKNEEKYIQEAIAEIKRELKSPDMKIKATGIEKLTYLHMIGYDMEWAAFHVIEVMSQPQFHFKRIGYLAASQSFNEKTDVMVLTTQTFKVDIKSNDQYEAGIAINCLANICTPDLARDLVADVVTQVSSSKPYVRKKSVLALYRIFLKYPDALRPSFPRLKERLEDQDPAVISCAVNVICELARKNPQNYLGMAPLFYKLLTTLTNNWTLIKIVKLFGALTPLEPRLAKKLVEPLTNIINTTPAKSLLYECLNTVSKGMTKHLSIVRLAVEKLRMFVEDPDQNLKYLGLLGLTDILKTYPRIVADLKEVILDCLNDEDVTIRLRALDLLTGVATKKNLVDIIRKLMQHVHTSEGSYRDDLVEKIINTCKQNNYECIVNFQWYISVLMELTEVKGIKHGGLIAQQLMDVIIRVKGIRPYGAKAMVSLLNSPHLVDETSNQNSMHEVLYAAAWIVGEFVRYVEDPLSVLDSLLQPRIEKLPSRIQSVYVQAVLKVYACAAYPPVPQPVQQLLNTEGEGGEEQPDQPEVYFSHTSEESRISMLRAMRDMIASRFGIFLKSADIEVQERATTCLRILEIHASLLEGGTDISAQLAVLFDEDLNPVGPKAQKKVPVPQGLDLDEWINEPFEDPEKSGFEFLEESGLKSPVQEAPAVAPTATTALGATAVDRRKEYDIWYISKDSPTSKPAEQTTAPVEDKKKKDYDLNLGFERKPKKKGTKKGKKGKKHAEEEEQEEAPPARHLVVNSGYEMPENAVESDEEEKPDDKLNIDLRTPIREDEVLPTIKAYPKETVAKPAEPEKTEKPKTEKKKKKKDGKEKKSSNSGDKEKKKSKKKGEESKKKDELINFFDDLAVSAGTPTAQPAAAAEEKPKRKKKEKSSKDKKETKEKKEKKSSSSKSSKTSAASTSAAAAQSPSHKPYLKKLAEDDNLTISYNTQVQPISANNIMVPLILQNIGSASIASIEYNLTDTMNTRLIRTAPPSQPLSAMFTLAPGGTNNVILQLTFNSFNRPQKLSGQVNYKLQGQPDPIVLPFQLTLPCSVFITPVPITPDACRDLVASQACPHLSSTRVTLNNRTLQAAFNDLANLLRVRVVEVVDSHAALYGRSVQDDHVLVLVKARSATEISVEIKSSDENLGTNLLREVTSYFQTE